VSYDLRFAATAEAVVDGDDDEDDYDEDLEEADFDEADEPPAEDAWARVVARAGDLLGDVETAVGQLTDPSGLQLEAYADRAELSVPYHYPDRADAVMRTLYGLAAIVEEELGLVGYDPQVEALVSTVDPDLGRPIEAYRRVAALLGRG
jgi:hypothetical protein